MMFSKIIEVKGTLYPKLECRMMGLEKAPVDFRY